MAIQQAPKRLYSLDALRGFDMFWIMGAEEIVHALYKATGNSTIGIVAEQFIHPEWNGFHFYDLIFPMFLFIAGVATPFSVGREMELGKSTSTLVLRVIKRAVILVLLGLIVNNGLEIRPLAEIRFGSVLGRIGLAYMFAAIIYIFSQKQQTHIIWFCGLTIGYYLILKCTSAPGFPTGDLTQPGNFASYIDRMILPGKLYLGNHDPEGLFSTIPAIGTGLLGIMAGSFLKNSSFTGTIKALRLAVLGSIFVVLALIWNLDFPINKNLWSSSFVLLVGGLSLLFLSLFYYIIDVKSHKKWAFFFNVIGMNSIFIYLSNHFIHWEYTTEALFKWLGQLSGPTYGMVVLTILFVGIKWLALYFMYLKKVFLKV
jgi:predicted acyltransferase